MCGFPSVQEILDTAKNLHSVEAKALYVNTEYNRRLPIQGSLSDAALNENIKDNINSDVPNLLDRIIINRRGMFDTPCCREDLNSCGKEIDDADEEDVEVSRYFRCFTNKLRIRHTSSATFHVSSPKPLVKKRGHYDMDDEQERELDSVDISSQKRVRFAMLSATSSSGNSSDDQISSEDTSDDCCS